MTSVVTENETTTDGADADTNGAPAKEGDSWWKGCCGLNGDAKDDKGTPTKTNLCGLNHSSMIHSSIERR